MICLAAAAIVLLRGSDGFATREFKIMRPGIEDPVALVRETVDPLEPSRLSPKKFGVPPKPWEFGWLSSAYVQVPQTKQWELRFRVYSQERKEKDDLATPTARMYATLWGEMFARTQFDHSMKFNGRIIDVFLCWGGEAGGEQRFDVAEVNNVRKPVNTIYVYDVNSFTEPMEMARELAHEYGHAVLPAIGGYTAPESWANGYLGEKVFLTWIRDGMAEGRLTSVDAMGATKEDIDKWLAAHSDPLVLAAAQTFPTAASLTDSSAKGMDKYIGLAMLANDVLPSTVFWHSMLFTGSTEAKDYPAALVMAAAEPDEYEIKIPSFLADKPIWLPTGKGKITGGKILQFQGGWAKVQAPAGSLTVKNR